MLKSMLIVTRSVIHIRRIAGYKSPAFTQAMAEFHNMLTHCKQLPDSHKPLVADFWLVYEALARDNMHMLNYTMNKYVAKNK